MRIILSRKGFDSGYGGVASPILPDGRLLSLPIPYNDPLRTFGTVVFDGKPISEIVLALTNNGLGENCSCHLDPDLKAESVRRENGWRPIFGQVDAAQTHLANQQVQEGDIFLFFGWFKHTEWKDGKLVFVPRSKDLHVIYGWLQVGEMSEPTEKFLKKHPWAKEHPHCLDNNWGPNNMLYIASEELMLSGMKMDVPGAGVFPAFSEKLQLTVPGETRRTFWRLPAWFHPEDRESSLSYHGNLGIWARDDGYTILKSRSKGQEFVLNAEHYPEAIPWIKGLFEN